MATSRYPAAEADLLIPSISHGVLRVLHRYTIDECRDVAECVLQAPRPFDVERILVQLGE